jgi:uncharacterized membrane protein YdfJ with MMPL/SSD domain
MRALGRSKLSPVVARLVDLAVRRPWALLAGNLLVLAGSMAIAIGGANGLPIGSLASSGSTAAEPDLIVATTGRTPVNSAVYQVALRVISTQVQSDPAVAQVRQGPVSPDGRSTSLLVALSGLDASERQDAVKRIEASIDAGPLDVAYGGQVATVLEARHDLAHDFWKLELLAMPFVALVLAIALGPRLAAAPLLSAATAITGTLAGLVLLGLITDVSILGIAPAAVLGLVIGVEAPCALFARYRAEATRVPVHEAIQRAVGAAGDLAIPVGVAASLVTVGLLATDVNQAGSMIVACALAAALALISALVSTAAIVSLATDDRHIRGQAPVAAWLERRPAALAGFLATSGRRTTICAAIGAILMLAAAAPLLHGQSSPFSAADLPADSPARLAAGVAGVGAGEGGGSLFANLPLAAAVSTVALVVVFAIGFRSRRAPLPLALVSLLPAAAACGLCVLVFQDGHLAGAINQSGQGALETGAVASLLAALVSVSAARSAAILQASRDAESLGLEPGWAGYSVASMVVPGAILATVIAAAATGVLAGADLYAAREFGLAVSVGLLIDLLVLRPPLIAALARWGPG